MISDKERPLPNWPHKKKTYLQKNLQISLITYDKAR